MFILLVLVTVMVLDDILTPEWCASKRALETRFRPSLTGEISTKASKFVFIAAQFIIVRCIMKVCLDVAIFQLQLWLQTLWQQPHMSPKRALNFRAHNAYDIIHITCPPKKRSWTSNFELPSTQCTIAQIPISLFSRWYTHGQPQLKYCKLDGILSIT